MKRLNKALVAGAAMAMMATPAYAIQADFTGFFQARAFTYDNLYSGDDAIDDQASGVDQRFRLWTNTALHENVKAVFAIEVDNVWGDAGVGRVGADAKGQIEIKQLYLDFNVPTLNTNVKAGAHFERLGGGIIKGDDATGLSVRYTPVRDMSFLLSWTKMRETARSGGSNATDIPGQGIYDDRFDSDYYHLQYDGTFGGFRLSPFVGYMGGAPTGIGLRADDGTAPGFSDRFDAWFLGAEASGQVGPLGLYGTAIYNRWDNREDLAPGVDTGNGYALLARATYAMGPTTFSLEGAFYGDDEVGAFVSVRGYNNYAEIITGGRFDGRSDLGGSSTVAGVRHDYWMNHMYAKLGAEHRYTDATRVSVFYIYAEEAQRRLGAPERMKFGHEIDLYIDHAISRGVTWTVGGGYLFADSRFGRGTVVTTGPSPGENVPAPTVTSTGGDDAWKVGTAITYTF